MRPQYPAKNRPMTGRCSLKRSQQAGAAFKKFAIAVSAALVSAAAQAQTTTTYSFGTQIAGDPAYQPAVTFATLSVTTSDSMAYLFDLQLVPSFGAIFGNSDAIIHRVVFNSGGNIDPVPDSVKLASGGPWGVSNLYYSTNDQEIGGIVFDFMEGWGNPYPTGQLTSGERVVWESSFTTPTTFDQPPFAVKVFGFGSDGSGSAYYVPSSVSPVPEPETYALMLAGLGLLGVAARRRNRKPASGV
jgi:hypothetical protein